MDLRSSMAEALSIEGPRTRAYFDEWLDGSEDLAGLVAFASDGEGGLWYADVEDRLKRGAGAIYHLDSGSGFGRTRHIADSLDVLAQKIAEGLDPRSLPTFDQQTRVGSWPGADVVRMHATSGTAAGLVLREDLVVDGLPVQAGARVSLREDGRLIFADALSRSTEIDHITCLAGTRLSLHPQTLAPLAFTPTGPVELDGVWMAANHEVQRFDEVFSPASAGTLLSDTDVAGVPLKAGTRVVRAGSDQALREGVLREDAVVAGRELSAGTWFEIVGGSIYQTR